MNDFELFARLPTGGDLFANETVYHKLCMSEYHNEYRTAVRNACDSKMSQHESERVALADIVEYIIEYESDGPCE